jgi:hypothetical protein
MEYGSVARVKEHARRLPNRMDNCRKEYEKATERGFAVLETNGVLFAWGYANERWGKTKDRTAGLHEITVAGVPADLGVGLGLLGLSFFGGLGPYSEHGVNLGNGSTGAFSYRMGAELGRNGAMRHTTASSVPAHTGTGHLAQVPVARHEHHVRCSAR